MTAKELQIISFLQEANVQFVIPVYQRNYDWTTKECKELLQDVLSVESLNRGTHFIGSIVFIHEGLFNIGEVKELVIIDGQQRLTTLNILYVALYRFANENNLSQDAERIYNMFLTNQYVDDDSNKLKLKQTDLNSKAFEAILTGNENQFNSFSNVIENYNYFYGEINSENFKSILNGLSRLIFVSISLERDKDDPQRIFESLNSTGLALSQSDLIRNYILMDLPPKEQNKIFKTIWNPIEENAKELHTQKSMVSEYIRDYLTLRNNKIPNKSRVYVEFKNLYFDKKEEAYYQELERIKSFSYHYKSFVNPETVPDMLIRKELEYINRLEINVAYPFLLQVFEDADNGLIERDDLLKVLQLVQSYAWRRFIVGLPTNALNKIFMTLYAEVDVENYYESVELALIKKKGSGKFPTNEDIKTALKDKDLYNIKAKNRTYMFELLENYKNKEFVDTANEHITIEHIFPRNPHESWSEELTEGDYFLFKEKYLNTLANLTLSGNNAALSNKSFSEKQKMNNNDGEQGYNYSRLWLNSYLNTLESWDVKNYEKRLELIYRRFLTIWKYPIIVIEEVVETEDENIFDAERPTHKKLEYFIFEDTKVEEDAIAQMYFYVINQFYEKNSQLITSHQDVLKITRNTSDFRAPQEVANGWYIESNIDSNTKFNVLKKLLSLFEMEDELSIKYLPDSGDKQEVNRHSIRRAFWKQLLPQINSISSFSNISPANTHWLSAGAGTTGISYTLVVIRNCLRIELDILTANKKTNKQYFRKLLSNKEEIEKAFGHKLVWEELPENKMCRIKFENQEVSVFNENDWEEMNAFIIKNLPSFEKALKAHVGRLK